MSNDLIANDLIQILSTSSPLLFFEFHDTQIQIILNDATEPTIPFTELEKSLNLHPKTLNFMKTCCFASSSKGSTANEEPGDHHQEEPPSTDDIFVTLDMICELATAFASPELVDFQCC